MDFFGASLTAGPISLPIIVPYVVVTALIVRIALPPLLRLAGVADEKTVTRSLGDLATSVFLIVFVVWKIFPIFEIFPAIRRNPALLIRAPGGLRGLGVGALVGLAFVGVRVRRVRDWKRAIRAIAVAVSLSVTSMALVGGVLAIGLSERQTAAAAGKPETIFMTMLDGTEVTLSELSGKPVVLTFWATWCGPCKAELPYKIRLYNEYGDRAHIIGVNVTQSETSLHAVTEYVERNAVPFPIAIDTNGALSRLFLVRGTPTTIIIDRTGEIVARWTGPVNTGRVIPFLQ